MDNDDAPSEYQGIAAAFAKAKAEEEKEEASGLRGRTEDAKAANKRGEVHFKASHGLLVAFFTFVLLLHVVGIYLFTSGFLLTRLVLNFKSECAVPPISLTNSYQPGDSTRGCWHPRTFDKAVVIVVDALRYDFTVPFRPKDSNDMPSFFHNALPFLHEISVKEPNNAFLRPFIADPPTTTLQRLKGLTTGTLPTFIDAGSNFAGTAIDEDNLVAQLRNASKRIVHIGDDTWHALFPGYFEPNLTRAYDSFNVWDLHTVDNGVNEHIFPLLQTENTDKWDIIIGHYLGVDHAGHRYGPEHREMTAKLNQMDQVFRDIVKLLHDDTLLVVMGDHGMDVKGDHGGESDDEIQAALWMYSKKGIFGRTSPDYIEPPSTAKERPVAQIDLVPTLSLLLGMPIPFNNLGTPIEEAFIGKKGKDFANLATVNRITSAQIRQYQRHYAQARGLDESATSPASEKWALATQVWDTAGKRSLDQWREVSDTFQAYQAQNLEICRSLWARFDVPAMLHGVEVLVGTILVLVVYARAIQGDHAELTPVLLSRGVIGSVGGAIVGALAGLAIEDLSILQYTLYFAAVGGIAGMAWGFYFVRQRLRWPLPRSVWSWICITFPIALSIGFASNSYTIWEDEILLHFLVTLGVLLFASSFRQDHLPDKVLGSYHSIVFIVLTRAASFSRLCREEQMPSCRSSYYASANSSTSAMWQLAIPAVVALLLPTIIRSYYDGTKSYQGAANLWFGYALHVGLTLCAVFWTLDAADDGDWFPNSNGWLKTIRVPIAQLILAIAFAAGYSFFGWSPPFLNVDTKPSAELQAKANGPGQPAIASQGGSSSITILGYANVHGSRYFQLVTVWLLAVILAQKPMGNGAIGILCWQIMSLLEILDTNNLTDTPVGPIVLGLLGSFHFFKTGHQATLSSIQWESAFIPLHTIRYPWSPLMVVLNTFGAQILCAVAVPATVLWKQPPKKRGLLGDVAKALATHLLFYAVINLATTMWAGHLRRHLMLYRIFSPRFMTGAAVLIIVDIIGIFVGLGGVRWSFWSVAEVFGWS